MNDNTDVFDVDNDYIYIDDDKEKEIIVDNNNVIKRIDKKSELTIDFIMIVGKYYESNKDFINTMKLTKKYQELVSMYKFNPISDTSLFENLETQHFYIKKDLNNVLRNKFKYINWTKDYITNKTKYDNLIKYLVYEHELIYDTSDGEMIFDDNEKYTNRILNKRSLFTIDILYNYRDKFIDKNKLIVPDDFSRLDKFLPYYSIFYDIKEIILSDNITYIPRDCFTNLQKLETIVFPRNSSPLLDRTVLNCIKLKNIYISPIKPCFENCFYKTAITQIILSKQITEDDFYNLNFMYSLSKIIEMDSVHYDLLYEEYDSKTVNIIVRNIKKKNLLFTTMISNYIQGYAQINENNIECIMNGVHLNFIFNNDIEGSYIDY